MKRKILIDTDPGVDDTLAIFLALGLGSAELSEVTTCCGNAPIEVVSRNASFILDRVGRHDIPVSLGATDPLAQKLITAVVHGEAGLGSVAIPQKWEPRRRNSVSSLEAMQRFLRDEDSDQRTIIALAPLTNVARLIESSPELLLPTDRLVILGGTYTSPGNKGPVAEFNFRCDPEAADLVLAKCPCEMTIVPLDVCMRNVLAIGDLARIHDRSFRDFLEELCRDFAEGNDAEEGISGILMYDPLAVFCALSPENFTFQKTWMRVDTGNSFARGMSVVDRRLRSDLPQNVSVATDVNWESFVETFFAALNRLKFVPA